MSKRQQKDKKFLEKSAASVAQSHGSRGCSMR